MSRQDYRAVAEVIRNQLQAEFDAARQIGTDAGVLAVENLAERIADMYAQENSRFDRDKFLQAALGSTQSIGR